MSVSAAALTVAGGAAAEAREGRFELRSETMIAAPILLRPMRSC